MYVEVTFGDKVKQLRYDFNAIADLEEKFGKGIAVIVSEEQVGFRALRLFYWSGLKWKDPGITPQRVGQMLMKKITDDGETVEELFVPVMKALEKSGLLKTKRESEESEDDSETEEKN
ncbi:hypothetical protein JCM15765_14690 [Paradesulfitobacterium aromaticivorans]